MHTSLFGHVLHAISYCHLCNLWLALTAPVRSDLQRSIGLSSGMETRSLALVDTTLPASLHNQ